MFDTLQSGMIVTLAGNGEPGFSGDGGPASAATLNEPKAVTFDQAGNLYIADSENHVIRRVDRATGLIHTIAGRPESDEGALSGSLAEAPVRGPVEPVDPLADDEDSPANAYTQTPDLSGTVRYVVGKTAVRFFGDGEEAGRALLNFPSGLVVDHWGVVFIADTWNHRIRAVDPATGRIQTIAGTGQPKWSGDGGAALSAALNEPVALALDVKGRLYVADQSNNRVRMIETDTGRITSVAGTGEAGYNGDDLPAVEASLAGPSGLALDSAGNLYIADTFNGRIRKVDSASGIMSTVVGDGGEFRYQPGINEGSLSVSRPYGIALDHQNRLLITDSDNHLVRTWDGARGRMDVLAGNGVPRFSGDGMRGSEASLNFPFGVAVDRQGNVAIADTFNHRVRLIAV